MEVLSLLCDSFYYILPTYCVYVGVWVGMGGWRSGRDVHVCMCGCDLIRFSCTP